MIKNGIARCYRWMVNILVTLLLLVALLLTLSRASVFYLAHQRKFVEHWLSVLFTQPVQIHAMKADWSRLNPGVSIDDVVVRNKHDAKSFIEIKQLFVSVDIIKSLLHWSLYPKRLVINGVNLDIDEGNLSSSQNFSLKGIVQWVLAKGNVDIQHANVDFHASNKKTYYLRDLSFQVTNTVFEHRISGAAVVNKTSPTSMQFVANLKDINPDDDKFDADFYVQVKDIHLEQWESLKVSEGDADLALWGHWHRSEVSQLQGRWTFKNVLLPFSQTKQYLAINHLFADFLWHPKQDAVDVQLSDMNFSLPTDYQHDFQVSKAFMQLQWEKQGQDLYLHVPYFQFLMKDMKGKGAFYLQLPKHGKPVLDLISEYQFPDLSQLSSLIPNVGRSSSSSAWFKQAFASGEVTTARLVYRGPIISSPFKDHQARLDAELHIKDGRFLYRQGWPAVTHLNGAVVVNNNEILASFPGARIASLPIKAFNLQVNNFYQPKLVIKNALDITAAQWKSALKSLPQSSFEKVSRLPLQGLMNIHLSTIIDFTDPGFPVVSNGDVTNGTNNLAYDLHVKNSILHADVVGKMNLEPFALKHLDGNLSYRVSVDANPQKKQIDLQSNLKGVELTGLPDFLNKKPSKIHNILLQINLLKGKPIEIRLRYFKSILLRFLGTYTGNDFHLLKGALYVGGKTPQHFPSVSGFVIYGDLASFNWSKWRPIIHSLFHEKNGALVTPIVFGLPLRYVEFSFNQVEFSSQKFSKLFIKLVPRRSDWMVKVTSPQVKGNFYLPNYSGGTWTGTLDYLHLAKVNKTSQESKSEHKANVVNPRSIPPIDLDVKDLRYGMADYGELEFRSRPNRKGMSINTFSVNSPWLTINMSGLWEQLAHHQTTMLKGDLQTNDLGKVIADCGYPGLLERGDGSTKFQLYWPNAINKMKARYLTGYINFDFRHGRLLKIAESKTTELGWGRVVNAFSIQDLPQHLSLHFKDITSEGLGFRTLKGEVSIKDGLATMENTVLDSPVAKLTVSGSINFVHEYYNMDVAVAPYVTSSVPLIVGIAGGPIAGALAWVVNKIATPEIGKAIGFVYHVKGTWKTPKLVKLPRPAKTHG